MIYLWLLMLLPVVAVTLPILRVFGVVTWQWKYVLAPIWAPLVWIFAWLLWIFVPIITLSLLVLFITGGKTI